MRLTKGVFIALAPLVLAACISPHGDQFAKPEEQVLEVPEIDARFAPIPLRVAVYISPQAANAITYDDRRKLEDSILAYDALGPVIAEAVAEYFPRVFSEASLINDFPGPAAQLMDADAVLVFESGAGSVHMTGGGLTYFVDTLLNVGAYSLQGERLAKYRVVSTSRITAPFETNMYRAMQISMAAIRTANKTAVRLALHRFPREVVLARKEAPRATPEVLAERKRALHATFAASAPVIPGPTEPAMAWIDRMAKRSRMLSAMSATTSGGLTALGAGNSTLNVLQQSLNRFNMNYATNPDAAADGAGIAFIRELLGGFSEEAQRRKAAQDFARAASGGARASPDVCRQFSQFANQCRTNQRDLGGGTTGQAGSFHQCARVYQSAFDKHCR